MEVSMFRLRKWFRPSSQANRYPRSRPRLEALEDRCTPSVTYHGGPLLNNVGVETLYYGRNWFDVPTLFNQALQLDRFMSSITDSVYMDQLTEYSEPGKIIGRGHFLDGVTSSNNLTPNQFVQDQDIRNQINAYIQSGVLHRPDSNRLYVVFTPPNIHVQLGNKNSINDFLGYHWTFTDSFGETVYYAVVVHQAGNASLQGYNAFQQFTKVTSHELAEAVTDPNTLNGWFDANGNEIGDLTNGGADITTLNGYTVQNEWSNEQFAKTGNGHFLLQSPNVQSFNMDNSGTLYELDTGRDLWRRDYSGNWAWVDGSVQSYLVAGNGYLYVEGTDGNLWYEDVGWWQHGRAWVDGSVQSYAIAGNGYLYVEGTDGNLWYEDVGWWQHGRAWVDGSVQSYAIAGNGYLYVLGTDGNLWYEGIFWQLFGRTWVDGSVQSFAVAGNGYLYVQGTDGNLWYEDIGWWQHGRTWVDGSVQSFANAGSGYLYVLGTDGNLCYEDIGWWQHGRTWVDGNVLTFAVGNNGYLEVLGSDHNLWYETIGWWSTGRTLLGQNIPWI
jgi:hypothetical protein